LAIPCPSYKNQAGIEILLFITLLEQKMFRFVFPRGPASGLGQKKDERKAHDNFLLRLVTDFDEALAGEAPRFEKGKGSGAKEDPSPASSLLSL
jgi:hypothetical protein